MRPAAQGRLPNYRVVGPFSDRAVKQRTPATDEGRQLWNAILGPVPEVPDVIPTSSLFPMASCMLFRSRLWSNQMARGWSSHSDHSNALG